MNTTTSLVFVATIVPAVRPSYAYCYQYPKEGLPDWFIQDILLPYEKVFCETATPYYLNATHYVIIDRATGGSGDYRTICWGYPKMMLLRAVSTWHRAFRGFILPPAVIPIFLVIDNIAVVTICILLCLSPVIVACMLFGLHIIRKVLHQSDSHVYVYHSLLVSLEIILYLLGMLQLLDQTSYIFLPGCLASAAIAAQFSGYIATFGTTLLESLFCFASFVQALMALDRVFAVYTPVGHRAYANARMTVKAIAVAFLVNFTLTLYEALVNIYHVAAYTGLKQIIGSSQLIIVVDPLKQAGMWIRMVFIIVGVSVQAVCCFLVFLKLRRMAKHPVGGAANASEVSLMPCYLLAGTCGVNLVSGMIDVLYTVRYTVYSASQQNYAFQVAHHISIPACCFVAVIIHCVVSARYREEAVKSLCALVRFLCPYWKSALPSASAKGYASGARAASSSSSDGTAGSSMSGNSSVRHSVHHQNSVSLANENSSQIDQIPNAVPGVP